ncbi:MAG TPA: sulfur transferase domain-containing protein [Gemmatimonadales bacterium]|nr:sulfur transferase domain-containing protein [Gemmatimonadales bacterium]
MSEILAAVAGVVNIAEPFPGFVSGGQPETAHLAALKAAGCEVLLDLRDAMEPRPYRVPDAVSAAGLEYVNIPVEHGAISDGTFERMRTAARTLIGMRPAFACCNSGNRVGAALLPYLMLDKGMAEDDAVMLAMKMGMRNAENMESALAYVRKQQSAAGA